MELSATEFESLSDLSIKDLRNNDWECDIFSILSEQALDFESDEVKKQLNEHIGHHIF